MPWILKFRSFCPYGETKVSLRTCVLNKTARIPLGERRKMQTGWPDPA
ncbi:hypothetical protein Poly59_17160 [Rubripirellula reticaptiva]|uniref:Uncharacterized protein n=1 Tax=Rubripirellula reticaptiva TaxID=2528013 RepID=A0A5C6F243_9BACT|nr:hypothetical protein Poly59_17160 [Rubripirellula reticaptiva]